MRTLAKICAVAWSLLISFGASGASDLDAKLLAAAQKSQATEVRALVTAGADANARAADGSTPMLYAAHFGDPQSVRALLGAKADPNLANRYGVAPMHEAALRADAQRPTPAASRRPYRLRPRGPGSRASGGETRAESVHDPGRVSGRHPRDCGFFEADQNGAERYGSHPDAQLHGARALLCLDGELVLQKLDLAGARAQHLPQSARRLPVPSLRPG